MALPTPTAIATTVRYPPFGKRKWVWCSTISNIAAPTSAEITAGTELSGQVMAQNGFTVQSATIDAPDAGTTFTSKVGGRTSADDSSLTLYMSTTSVDARGLFTRNTAGYMVIAYEGLGAGTNKMDVFPATVTAQSKSSDIEALATLEIQFAITAAPAENVAVPTV